VLHELFETYNRPETFNHRHIRIADGCEDVVFESDLSLVQRVLGNMVKNAMEAAVPGETVTLGCNREPEGVSFRVHNPTYMPKEVRLQVFKRSFSTKGAGRGLGTYSMKFLSENYLGGKISFTSTETEGTTFRVTYPVKFAGKKQAAGRS
jgi:signal transduction histidine kinase